MTREGFSEGPSSVDALAARGSLALENRTSRSDSVESQMALSQSTWDSIKQKIFGCPTSPVYDGAIREVIGRFYDQSKVKVLSSQLTKHNCEIKSDDQAVEIANKVLEAIEDPFTHVLKKKDVDEMQKAIRGESSLTGIGIVVGPENPDAKAVSRPKVQMVFPGTPAHKAGMRNGDIILAVDGKDTKGMSMDDVTKMLKGTKGTEVAVRIDRQGKMFDLKPVRDVVNIPAAVDERIDDVLYVRLFDFVNDKSDQQLNEALVRNPDAKGLILDLRGNGGGRVDEMIEVLGLVMKKGKIVDTTEMVKSPYRSAPMTYSYELDDYGMAVRQDGRTVERMSRNFYRLGGRPLILLVDEYSASASELMAGALKDNQAAVIVGEKTFGKGIGQIVIPNANGTAVLVTDTKYTSPNGTWAGNGDRVKNGIEPNVNVPLGDVYLPLSDEDTQFKKAMEIIRAKIDKKDR